MVFKPATIRTVLRLAASRHWHFRQLNVKNAFLYGTLFETVYMHQPPGFCDLQRPDYGSDVAYLLLHVDDILLKTSSIALLQRIISSLHHEFSMTVLVQVGADSTLVFDPTLYRSLVGALQYLTFTPLDVSYAVQQVCLYMHDPREPHLAVLERILRYVRGTLDYGLQFAGLSCRGVSNAVAVPHLRDMVSFSRASLSSTLCHYCLLCAVYLSSHPVQHGRTKHIEIGIHFVRDQVSTRQVRVLHVPSRYQYAVFHLGAPFALPLMSFGPQMQKKHSLESIALRKDTFNVRVFPNVDYAFIVALVVILDQSKINKKFT
ncbi:ribonuclease H-like domain-containing protein [Tanacetum coccineum]